MEDNDIPELGNYDEYDAYEDQYADEFEMMNEVEEENIDFEVLTKKKKKTPKELDNNLLQDVLKKKFSKINTNNNIEEKNTVTSTGKKRSFSDDLVGIDDIADDDVLKYSDDESENENMIEAQPKKQKLDEFKTKPSDKLASLLKDLQQSDDTSMNQTEHDLCRKRVFRRPVLGEDSLNITSTDGNRVFLKLRPDEDNSKTESSRWQSNETSDGLNLLPVPFQSLKTEVDEKRHAQHIARLENLTNTLNQDLAEARAEKKTLELWVEKYSPKQYTELLSDDGTNRLLLKWLKLWDNVVFPDSKKHQPKNNNKQQKPAPFSNQNDASKDKDFKNFKNFQKYDFEDELVLDNKKRPKRKIALLCGNPGLGKTTLAHVISQHAGYNVVEMNASDDRSPEVFLNRIESTTQMKSMLGANKRPNCLVIDEIDGAPVQAINILLDLIKFTETSSGKKQKKRNKKKKEFLINRPIICICNDQYVPALRQLRHVAFTLNFPPTLGSRLAGRLMTIAHSENLRIDMGALLLLSDKAENDIRSCLNTLQFINERSKDFKPEDLKNLEVGQKDMKKGVRHILSEIFQLPRSKKKLYGIRSTTMVNPKSSAAARFHYVMHLVSGNSDFDKMMQGLFDHYLNVKTKDPYFESVNQGCDWMIFADLLEEKIRHNQDFVMRRYTMFLPVAFHIFFARARASKLQYTNVTYENYLKTLHNIQTFDLMKSGMHPTFRRYCLRIQTLLELIPYLFLITSPNLRPVNTKLYSTSEKQMFASLIEVMISYNLTFRQERNTEGQYTYLLEPNIEELTTFTGLPQHKLLPYATKQLIAREVDMEKMRRAEKLLKPAKEANKSAEKVVASKPSIDVMNSQKLTPKLLGATKEKQHLDFFGRIVKDQPPSERKRPAKPQVKSPLDKKIWFHFNEGYTNAVRKPVKISEFL